MRIRDEEEGSGHCGRLAEVRCDWVGRLIDHQPLSEEGNFRIHTHTHRHTAVCFVTRTR